MHFTSELRHGYIELEQIPNLISKQGLQCGAGGWWGGGRGGGYNPPWILEGAEPL